MLSGDNGVLQRATDAKTNTDNAQIKEKIRLAYTSALTKDISNQKAEVQKSTFEDELEVEFPNKTINIENSNDNKEWIVTIDGVTENVPIGKDTPKNNGKLASEIFEATGTTEGKMHVGDYVNYPVYYDNVSTGEMDDCFPVDTYLGWRVLSIEGTGDNAYIRLVSAGVPLNYYHGSVAATTVENLTTKFFNIPIDSTSRYTFRDCGFKTAQNGTKVTSISDVMGLFNNSYTAKYSTGENATYTDGALNQTFTNSNVAGQPKVQSITKADFDKAFGTSVEWNSNVSTNDLLAIPCKSPNESSYAGTWMAYSHPFWDDWAEDYDYSEVLTVYHGNGEVWSLSGFQSGVRCVVTLTSNVKYSLAEGSNSTDALKTWNIE